MLLLNFFFFETFPFSFSQHLLSMWTWMPIFIILAQLLQEKSRLVNPIILYFGRSWARVLIFGIQVYKAKLTLHTEIRYPSSTFLLKTKVLAQDIAYSLRHSFFFLLFFWNLPIFIFPSSIVTMNLNTDFHHPSSTPSRKK